MRPDPDPGRPDVQVWRAMALEPDLDVVCPRCGSTTTGRFYGPCAACRDELRATLGNEARQAESVDYEPKMNVTPNAVALRD